MFAEPHEIRPEDLPALLALNNAHAAETSPLTAEGLAGLLGIARVAAAIDGSAALLVALDQDAPYDNPNFRWFKARYERFLYVDRVIVAPAARGQGYARALYVLTFQVAEAAGHGLVVAEVDADPPNVASDALHRALGFVEVGRATLAEQGRTIRYLERHVRRPLAF